MTVTEQPVANAADRQGQRLSGAAGADAAVRADFDSFPKT